MSFACTNPKKSFLVRIAVITFVGLTYWSANYYAKDVTLHFFPAESELQPSDTENKTRQIAFTSEGGMCSCNSTGQLNRPPNIVGSKSLCQYQTSDRGWGQKVISYSLDGDVHNPQIFKKYFSFFHQIAHQISELYPGWIMRIYHKYNATDVAFSQHLCPTYCNYSHVDLCNVTDLQMTSEDEGARDISYMYSRMWRFAPMADPTVDLFLSRDIDSSLTMREWSAVQDWLHYSNKTVHVMRDHPYHTAVILAGMWGARMDGVRRKDLRNWFLKTKTEAIRQRNSYDSDRDQDMLVSLHKTFAKSDLVRHQSYHCTDYSNISRPFPTKRDGYVFVGSRLYKDFGKIPKCPARCRPRDHQDWEYC